MEHISPQRLEQLETLEKKIGAAFTSKQLLNQAFTHSSFGHEKKLPDNERMEFLGDAVLKLVVSEYLYLKFPERAEGGLTKIRASVISDDTLSKIARDLSIGDYLLLSENEKKTGGARRKSNLANVFEALLGAIFLDSGIGKSREFILGALSEEISRASHSGFIRDYKSALQEYAQKRKWELPRYRVVKETGPKHRRVFWMEVKVKGRTLGVGRGRNKKESEQRAAMQALRSLKIEEKSPHKKERNPRGIGAIISQVRRSIKI
ncbi:MAG: ribonuclease III [Candidatus Margulisbacteria bacterium]|nr:ribonuclease III [Candidatus Margulisiibacteriota bacterium]